MRTYNYVQEAWEERFHIQKSPRAAYRFAMGFMLGALVTGAVFLFSAASAGPLGF